MSIPVENAREMLRNAGVERYCFVSGYGMDIGWAWRNLPAIYAVKEKLS